MESFLEEKNPNSIVGKALIKSKEQICSSFKINESQFDYIADNFKIRSELSGHNNQVCLVDFCDEDGRLLGGVCVKYSFEDKMLPGLLLETDILDLFSTSQVISPRVLGTDLSTQSDFIYVITTVAEGHPVTNYKLQIDDIEKRL